MKLFETIEKPIRKLIEPLTKSLEKLIPGKKPDFYSHVVVGALLTTLGLLLEIVLYISGNSGIARYQEAALWVGFAGTALIIQVLLAFYEGFQSIMKGAAQGEVLRDIKNYAIGVWSITGISILVAVLLTVLF